MRNDKFPRPDGALYLDDLHVGLNFYEVNGTIYGGSFDPKYQRVIVPASISPDLLLSSYFNDAGSIASVVFEAHSSYEDIHFSQKNEYVFDSVYTVDPWADSRSLSGNEPHKQFAGDNNLYRDHSHNDNYIFSDPDKAQQYALWVQQYWLDHPDERAAIREEHDSWNRLLDFHYDDDSDLDRQDYYYNENENEYEPYYED